ncbi:MAG TPA: ABC transporter permease [Candidatus Dormibacteraeota bacterium]|nr:ABC transporter permease [Candidatus Dormibacteraeota bacterium]
MASTELLPERSLPQRPRAPHAGPIAGRVELLLELVRRDVKSRYRGSVLGVAWTLLNPLIFMLVYSLVFGKFLRVQYPGHSATVFILSGLLAWTFFSQALIMATSSIVANAALVRKVAFPWAMLSVSSVIAALVNYVISLVLLVPFMLLSHKGVGPPLLAVPVLVGITFALSLGLGLMLAAGNVYLRDLQYLVNLGTLIWFYVTPIIYPFSLVQSKFSGHGFEGQAAQAVLYLNPMTWVVLGFQDVFVFDRWPQHWHGLGYSLVASLISIWLGLRVFRRLRRRFAEEV